MIQDAVEKGIAYAMGRAWKYEDAPGGWEEDMAARIGDSCAESVMNELSYVLNFDDRT